MFASPLRSGLLMASWLASAFALQAAEERRLSFNRDIRPILSENCFHCHGQDPKQREAELRLDLREEAIRDLGGYAAIVPGKPEQSELLMRLTSHDRDEVMPPPKSNRQVTAAQIEVLRQWIAQGAEYEKHWAFLPPVRPGLPAVKEEAWSRSGIDRFVLARLEAESLSPAPEAKPETWLRRASFDTTGVAPTPAEADSFLADVAARGEAAYGAAVDRLLSSPRFGERQAIDWLDAARYADTHGFNNDSARSMWRWRDWVIDAFNGNQPYDQFITEQLAGDLLPDASVEQRLATGFGRNHVISSEGGIIDEEYRVEYVADRVRTTSMAWLGLTTECARCHDHKFDPITQRDYYRFFAFFNQVPENGEDGRVSNAPPLMPAPTQEQSARLKEQEQELARLDAQAEEHRRAWGWDDQARPLVENKAESAAAVVPAEDLVFHLTCDAAEAKEKAWSFPGGAPAVAEGIVGQAWTPVNGKPLARIEGSQVKFDHPAGVTLAVWISPASDISRDVPLISNQKGGNPAAGDYGRGQELRLVDGEIEFRMNVRFPAYAVRIVSEGAAIRPEVWQHIALTYDVPKVMRGARAETVRMFVDGREVRTRTLTDGFDGGPSGAAYLLGADAVPKGPRFRGAMDDLRVYKRALAEKEVQAVFAAAALPYALLQKAAGKAGTAELAWLRDCVLTAQDGEAAKVFAQRSELWQRYLELRRSLPTAMVMADMSPARPTFLLSRGQYDAHGPQVEPGALEELLVPWPEGAPRNRLGLARWLTRPDHPLTARVVVNRFWHQLFGTGLVKTLEDFGFQGEWPSHPELLDLLAREFIDSGWDVKALFRQLLLSATYRQSSDAAPELIARDPENRLLARGPRVRLPAELIRDHALSVSGLLTERIGGPSVFPDQPTDLYKGVVVGTNYPGSQWVNSAGGDLYRRSLYTFWKRTVPHPVMLAFDAPEREFCAVRRSRTNTPLQALVLMNEPALLEAARHFAARVLREGGGEEAARLALAFRMATGRSPTPAESDVLIRSLARFRDSFRSDAEGAKAFAKEAGVESGLPAEEIASYAALAHLILNLDETITKN